MKIYFESWIHNQDISEDAQILFDEAFMCYRVGAYRASLLMSYLGFMKALRDRLLNSDTPDLYHEEDWKKKRNDLRDDKVWEETVFTTINEKHKKLGKVFLINNDLIEEVSYWRKKRNDCAHAKDSIIGNSHVESFWLFLESNLAKFVVNGGKQALLLKIKKHFDPKFTKPGTDFYYLINDLPLVVRQGELSELLQEIYSGYVSLDAFANEEQKSFWNEIAYSPNDALNKAFLEFVVSNEDTFVSFIEMFPDRLILCTEEKELIRLLWKDFLFKKIGNYSETFWDIAITLLRNKLIPEDEIAGFIRRLVQNINAASLPNPEQTTILKKFGLFKAIKDTIFSSGILNKKYVGYDNANKNASKIIYYLKNETLDIDVVRELNTLFKSYSFGHLYGKMMKWIEENPPIIDHFGEIANENNLSLAEFFTKGKNELEE
ncbi:hypothetical protein [Oceanobacillus massiliensis]|uniref:hypothetical protein n=1 Tax=Oceanobacillus massiliensis TaxID=1465765 RepID=UPI003017234C